MILLSVKSCACRIMWLCSKLRYAIRMQYALLNVMLRAERFAIAKKSSVSQTSPQNLVMPTTTLLHYTNVCFSAGCCTTQLCLTED